MIKLYREGKLSSADRLLSPYHSYLKEGFSLETLIVCPKNLTNMWEDYAHKYQLRAKVLSLNAPESAQCQGGESPLPGKRFPSCLYGARRQESRIPDRGSDCIRSQSLHRSEETS